MNDYEKRNADAFNGMLKAKFTIALCEIADSNYIPPADFILPLPEDATTDDRLTRFAKCMFAEGVRFGLELESETPGSVQQMKWRLRLL